MNKVILAALAALSFTFSHVTLANVAKVETNQTQKQMFTIDVNKASVDELITLKGVGKVKAKAIVSYRTKHGNFNSLDDLLQVKGIGEKVLSDNLSKLSI